MSTNFPSSLDTSATIPAEGASIPLSTNHVTAHQNIQDAIEAIEAKIRADSSAVTTSHDYKLGEITGSDKAVGKTATQTLENKTLGTGTAITLGSDAEGDTYYRNSSGVLVRLPRGTDNYILKMNGNVPNWEAETVTVDATSTTAGIVELATAAEITAGTATGSDGPLVVTPDQMKSSVYGLGRGYFGDGSDGNVTISANTDLTRDMNYANLTINSTFTLNTKGYRVFVNGTLTNNGTIANNGGNGSGVTGGTAGAEGTLLGGTAGATYGGGTGAGGGGGGGGICWIAARDVSVQGTIEAKGGNGANASVPGAGNANGAAGAAIALSLIQSGSGAAGGNCNGQSGGAGGVISANSKASPRSSFILNMMIDGITELAGGAGGGSGGGSVSNASAGGGGGGQGGVIVFIYRYLTTSGTLTVTGGTGGTGAGTGGLSGGNGSSGLSISLQV